MYIFVCAKVFIFYNAVKPCEICATKAKYLNQCITARKMLLQFDPTIMKSKGQIRRTLPSPHVAAINFFFRLHDIMVLNN